MAVRASKLMLDSTVPGVFKISPRRLSNLPISKRCQPLIPSGSPKITETSTLKPRNTLAQSSGRFPKSTLATPKLQKAANKVHIPNVTNDTGLNVDRLISRIYRSISAVAHNIQLHLDKKSLMNLLTSSNQQSIAVLGDQATLFAFRNGLGKSSNVNAMRPVQNWSSVGGSLYVPKMTQFRALGKNLAQNRTFSTTAKLEANGKKDGKECKKKGGGLPCLKPVGLGADDKSKKGDNKVCEKFCMPCCAPARDPPTCVVAQKKRECKKFKPPRPAYSECKKDRMKTIKPCECLIQRLPPCGRSEQSQSNKNC